MRRKMIEISLFIICKSYLNKMSLCPNVCYAVNIVCEANSFNLLNGCITRVKGARMSKQENHLSHEND